MSNSDKERDIQVIWTFTMKCPRCDSDFKVSDSIYEIPLVGKILISTGRCMKCGYRYSSVRAVESHGPQKLTLRVENPKDLNIFVLRASSATIKIPELGIEITPGPAAQGYITTVEGVLDRVLEVLSILKDDPEVDKEERDKREKMIKEAKEGKRKFTFVIIDPEGVSRIISDKVEKEKLYGSYIT